MKTKHFAFLLLCLAISCQTAKGQDNEYRYYDPGTPQHSWPVESNWGSFVMFGLSERVTLPADSGYVDSVSILFNQVSDTVHVLLVSDTLFTTSVGPFHLMNDNDPLAPIYASAVIAPPFPAGPTTLTVPFPHVFVPKEFHVLIAPSAYSSDYPQFSIIGDSEGIRARTPEISRSGFFAIGTNNLVFVSVLDSMLIPNGDAAPLFSNLYVTTYASEDAMNAVNETRDIGLIAALQQPLSGVTNNNGERLAHVIIFPNPASNALQIQSVAAISRVDLLDILGRIVLSQKWNGIGMLDVSGLEPGRYEAIVHTARGISTTPVLIRH